MKYPIRAAVLAGLLGSGLTLGNLMAGEPEDKPIRGSIALKENTAEARLPGLAKISLGDALAAGLRKLPGKALEVELKVDDGFLIYEVEIVAADQKVHVVTVDAGNGKILEVELDSDDVAPKHTSKTGRIDPYTKSQGRL